MMFLNLTVGLGFFEDVINVFEDTGTSGKQQQLESRLWMVSFAIRLCSK
jgi:hypothetical protein